MPPKTDGGGSIVGTPLTVLSSRTSKTAPPFRPLAQADRLAPPAASYEQRRERARVSAERDSLRDVHRTPEEIEAETRRARLPAAQTREDIMDDEDRAYAARRASRVDFGGGVSRGGHDSGHELDVVMPTRTRVSVGHAILRAQGVLSNREAGPEGVSRGESNVSYERRQKYRLGDLFAAAELQRRRGTEGLGFEGGAPFASAGFGDVRETKTSQVSGVSNAEEFDWGGVVDGDADGDENVRGFVRDGGLDAAENRMKAAMEVEMRRAKARPSDGRYRKAKNDPGSKHLPGVLSDIFVEDTVPVEELALSKQAELSPHRTPGKVSSKSEKACEVPLQFSMRPVHDWENDPFAKEEGFADDSTLKHFVDKLSAVGRKELSSLGAKNATRRHVAAKRRSEHLHHVQSTAGARLRSTFVRGSASDEPHLLDPEGRVAVPQSGPVSLENKERSVGDVVRKSYGWEPAPILCKRLGIERPKVSISEREAEEKDVMLQKRRERWKEATGLKPELESAAHVKERGRGNRGHPERESSRRVGDIRVLSIVSRDGQVPVVEDEISAGGLRDGIVGEGSASDSEGDDTQVGKNSEADDRVDSAQAVGGPVLRGDEEYVSAKKAVQQAVFGNVIASEAAGVSTKSDDDSEIQREVPSVELPTRKKWRAVDFF